MKIKNFKKCLAGTLSFLMVSSVTMLPASALSYPTDLSMAQINFSLSSTVSAPKNNLSAMYNSKASSMSSSAVRTNAGYETQGETPSSYGMTGQDVYNAIGDKDFISNSGWQTWGSQNAVSMPDYDSLISSKQATAEGTYNSVVSEMPETATNASNIALADLLTSNPTAATVWDNALNDYAASTILKAEQDAENTATGMVLLDTMAAEAKIQELKDMFANASSSSIIARTDEYGNITDTASFSLRNFNSSASNTASTVAVTYDETETTPQTIAEMMGINMSPENDADLLSIKDKLKLDKAGIVEESPFYTKQFADSLTPQDLQDIANGESITSVSDDFSSARLPFEATLFLEGERMDKVGKTLENVTSTGDLKDAIVDRLFPSLP